MSRLPRRPSPQQPLAQFAADHAGGAQNQYVQDRTPVTASFRDASLKSAIADAEGRRPESMLAIVTMDSGSLAASLLPPGMT